VIALRLVRLIKAHAAEIAQNLVEKIRISPRTASSRKIPDVELQMSTQELLQDLNEFLLNKSNTEIASRSYQLGALRASQGVALADVCWTITLTKEYLWDFLQKQASVRTPVEIYGEMELLRLLDLFFDRAICYAVEGYEQAGPSGTKADESSEARSREVNLAAWVP
jgi:hypothetical protein